MSARIHIETAGCAFNASDSEAMAGTLVRAGYEIVSNEMDADLIVLNTCTVKNRTFAGFQRRLRQLREENGPRRVVVAGCIPKAHEKSRLLDGISTLGPDQIARIDEVVRETLRGGVVRRLGRAASVGRSTLPIRRRNPAVEILPIARGCLSACAFCQTRLARGRLFSFPPEEILAQARRALDEGVNIFWVTAQDSGAYGRDSSLALPELLDRLLALPGEFRVRLGMSSPRWIAERLDEFLEVWAHPKMFRFAHIPLQSGSPRVLRDMRRDGGVEEFEAIYHAYPTEADGDFELTLRLVERLGLGFINVSKFSARPGTPAARLAPLSPSVVSGRTGEIMGLARRIGGDYLRRRVGDAVDVLIEQPGRRNTIIGRTENYRPVILRDDLPLGSRWRVRIRGAEPFHFVGEIDSEDWRAREDSNL
jgi:threonylcarbamoyladenosine tRNA methylthiotransferase CDKAL1